MFIRRFDATIDRFGFNGAVSNRWCRGGSDAPAQEKGHAELLITAQSFSYSLKFEIDPNHPQTLRGSFSAGSTATIATKYSFFQVFRDLQDFHTFAPLRSQNFNGKPSKFLLEICHFFRVFRRILRFFCEILMKFCRNFTEMFRKWQKKCWYSLKFEENGKINLFERLEKAKRLGKD